MANSVASSATNSVANAAANMAADDAMTGYAILGWGSLIWDLDTLAPHVLGAWALSRGPRLPMEFARISAKRKGALALCLDARLGHPCATHAIRSARRGLPAAIADLAQRERAPLGMIGGVCRITGACQGREEIAERVLDWCEAQGWAGAVWTDLRANFDELSGRPFTLESAEAYLAELAGPSRDEAVRYVTLAPAATDTALRRRLGTRPWWRAEVTRLGLDGA